MSDAIRLEDLYRYDRHPHYSMQPTGRYRPVTASEVASACPTEVLIEVLVERGATRQLWFCVSILAPRCRKDIRDPMELGGHEACGPVLMVPPVVGGGP